jgi:hypothetical protein
VGEVLHEHVRAAQQLLADPLVLGRLQVERDAALVAVEHREIEAVHVRDVPELAAGDIAAGRLHLDHVSPHPRQQLRAHRPRLDMGHVDHPDAFEGFVHVAPFQPRTQRRGVKADSNGSGTPAEVTCGEEQ